MITTVPVITENNTRRPDLPEGTGFTLLEDLGDRMRVKLARTEALDEALETAARLAAAEFVRTDEPDVETVTQLAPLFPFWVPGETVAAGDIRQWEGFVVKALQGHTTQAGWEPPNVPALWRIFQPEQPGELPERWVMPNTMRPDGFLQQPYALDELVVHDNPNDGGQDWVYRSKLAANTTEPGRDGTFDRWWEPVARASEWQG